MKKTGRKKDVLLCAYKDWANMGYIWRDCLRRNNLKADMFVMEETKIKYDSGINKITLEELLGLFNEYKYIQFMHSGQNIIWVKKKGRLIPLNKTIELLMNLKKQGTKVFVFHGGSSYRLHHLSINKILNKIVDLTLIQTPDLLNLGAVNQRLVFAPIDTQKIKPRRTKITNKFKVGHFTFDPKKNSALILSTLSKFDNIEILKDSKIVSHQENLDRISKCDIYIENQKYTLQGKPYATFGLTTLEAAALGKVVICCNAQKHLYEEEFGKFVPIISNSPQELLEKLNYLFSLSAEKLAKMKQEHRMWVEKNHSYENFGKKLIRLYKI